VEITGAIAYIRNWRESQNLDPLPPYEERESAVKLIEEKGYKLPTFIPSGEGSLQFKDGVYVKEEGRGKMEERRITGEEEKETSPRSVVAERLTYSKEEEQESTHPSSSFLLTSFFLWSPSDKREFWCEKLQSFVRMSGDLNADGTYWVIKTGEGNFRRYPAKGEDLILKENAPKDVPTTDLLLVNSATWADIKNCLVTKFIPSYPWSKKGERSPNEIREEMLTLAKSRRQGLASLIEDERKLGNFEDDQNFTLRMNQVYESFPWGDFTQMLDFN
jgi:hypothetical protein